MAISITCRCGNLISAPERLAGRTLRCPKCLGEFTVPQMVAPPPPPPRSPDLFPAPAPLAAMAAPPAEPPAFSSEATLPMEQSAFSPELTMPEAPVEMPMEMPTAAAEAPTEMPMEMPMAATEDPGFEVMEEEAPLEMAAEEVSALETQAGTFAPEQPVEEGMTFTENDVVAQDAPVMGEEELGMFLMEEEPPPPPPDKKKKKKKAEDDEDNVFG